MEKYHVWKNQGKWYLSLFPRTHHAHKAICGAVFRFNSIPEMIAVCRGK